MVQNHSIPNSIQNFNKLRVYQRTRSKGLECQTPYLKITGLNPTRVDSRWFWQSRLWGRELV